MMMPAYILAGGRSSRFGSDKARALFQGVPLIERTASVLRSMGCEITVVADISGKYDDLGLRTIADAEPGRGPLGGLATALVDAAGRGNRWILLVSCDLLVIKPSWIESLWQKVEPGLEFVAFRGDFWEPLLACYDVALSPRVAERLREGQTAMWKLLEASRGCAVPLPNDWQHVQANTPEELKAAAERLKTV